VEGSGHGSIYGIIPAPFWRHQEKPEEDSESPHEI
jgi:hypothetical protein